MARNMSIVSDNHKTTIPKGIRNKMGINIGTSIYWDISKDGKKIVGTPIFINSER